MATVKEFRMSQERYDELKKELDYSKTTRADEIAELIKEARGFGDLYLTPDCALRQEVRYAWPDPSQAPPPEGLLSLLHRACRLPEICVKSVETLDIGP